MPIEVVNLLSSPEPAPLPPPPTRRPEIKWHQQPHASVSPWEDDPRYEAVEQFAKSLNLEVEVRDRSQGPIVSTGNPATDAANAAIRRQIASSLERQESANTALGNNKEVTSKRQRALGVTSQQQQQQPGGSGGTKPRYEEAVNRFPNSQFELEERSRPRLDQSRSQPQSKPSRPASSAAVEIINLSSSPEPEAHQRRDQGHILPKRSVESSRKREISPPDDDDDGGLFVSQSPSKRHCSGPWSSSFQTEKTKATGTTTAKMSSRDDGNHSDSDSGSNDISLAISRRGQRQRQRPNGEVSAGGGAGRGEGKGEGTWQANIRPTWNFASNSALEPVPVVTARANDGYDDDGGSGVPLPGNPPCVPRASQWNHSDVIAIDDSDSEGSEEEEFPGLENLPRAQFILKKQKNNSKSRTSNSSRSKGSRSASASGSANIDTSMTRPASTKSSAQPKRTAEERAREKEERAAEREAERERRRLEKERLRARKALEKEQAAALAEVNKVRTDKKVSTPEMIVDLPMTLDESTCLQAETLLQDLSVQHELWSPPVPIQGYKMVKWRRKVDSRYDEELARWEPVPRRIENEPYAMVILSAAEFVGLVLNEAGGEGQGGEGRLEGHVGKIKRHFANHTILYLIEGLNLWMRKNRNLRNRQFASAVRNGLEPNPSQGSQQHQQDYLHDQQQQQQHQPPSSSQPQQRRRRNANANANNQQKEYIDEDAIEDALLELQVLHSVLIHHTSVPVETAQWIAIFTQHISTAPYRKQREAANSASAGFCMEAGQVRTGEDAREVYVRMLQEMTRVTVPIAYGIAAEFPTVSTLVRALERDGPLVLQDVRKSANREGAVTDRCVGKAISRRMHKVFLGRDETSMDI